MKKISVKNISLLGLVLMAASAATAAIIPDKSNARRANNGTLRGNSATAAGADQDASFLVISCINEVETVMSCTATADTNTTTGFFQNESLLQIGLFFYQTNGNTSQTGAITGDQNSILQVVS
ncbi:hypothetical protein L3C95_04475 [Chitinophaga filiformis]|uniref:hypothetical protein n=1 Tax=Chitinophaga filiformis TaxID=104663 RepID=UPI001F490664|nr:hypothetical protein [Chitinophaga filiformis]MCF6402116.1 hypothetical protein [Chitinophaga filiformis]